MDLSFSEEQVLLRDTAARVARDHGGVERRRALRGQEPGFSRDTWAEFAALGWLALPFPESEGGLGGSAVDLAILTEQMGRELVCSPFLDTVVSCGSVLLQGTPAQRERYLPPLIAGETQWSLASAESEGSFVLSDVTMVAQADGEDWLLDGSKFAAPNAHVADAIILSARTAGERRDGDGISLFIVPVTAPGVERRTVTLVDGSRGAHITLRDVRLGPDGVLGPLHGGLPVLETAVDRTIVAMGAEALGAMEALLEQTVAYSKTRVQFGKPIGSFQALQHRMADMCMQCQALRSLVLHAAITADAGGSAAARAAAGLKVKLCEAGRFVSQQAVQIHGGIGVTDELAVSHYFRRLMFLNTLFGDAEHHLKRYVSLG